MGFIKNLFNLLFCKTTFDIFEEDIYEKMYQQISNDNADAFNNIYLESKKIRDRLSECNREQLVLIKAHSDSFIAGFNITSKILIPLMGFFISILLLYLNNILSITNKALLIIFFVIWLVLLFWFGRILNKFRNRVLCARFINEIVDLIIEERNGIDCLSSNITEAV